MPKIVGKRGKKSMLLITSRLSNCFSGFFRGSKGSRTHQLYRVQAAGFGVSEESRQKIPHPIPFRHLKRFWFWGIPPKAREVLVTPCQIFGRRERAARLFFHPRVSLQWFWWVLVAKTQKIGPLFPHFRSEIPNRKSTIQSCLQMLIGQPCFLSLCTSARNMPHPCRQMSTRYKKMWIFL